MAELRGRSKMSNQENELKDLEKLVVKKEEIYEAELVGWLHNWTKCTDKHVQDQALFSSTNDNQINIRELDSWQVNLFGAQSIPFKNLIKRDKDKLLEKCKDTPCEHLGDWEFLALKACHSAAHMEKEEAIYLIKQLTSTGTRSSSHFGYETEYFTGLSEHLKNVDFAQMKDRTTFKDELGKTFSYASGDTRRQLNDISLWDWSYMAAALYKAAVVEYIIKGKTDPCNLQWRLLSIPIDNTDFLSQASRIPDLLARRELVLSELNGARKLLEDTYPLGTEVYRDENGSIFIVPDL